MPQLSRFVYIRLRIQINQLYDTVTNSTRRPRNARKQIFRKSFHSLTFIYDTAHASQPLSIATTAGLTSNLRVSSLRSRLQDIRTPVNCSYFLVFDAVDMHCALKSGIRPDGVMLKLRRCCVEITTIQARTHAFEARIHSAPDSSQTVD